MAGSESKPSQIAGLMLVPVCLLGPLYGHNGKAKTESGLSRLLRTREVNT